MDDKTIRDSQKAGQSLTDFTAGWTEKVPRRLRTRSPAPAAHRARRRRPHPAADRHDRDARRKRPRLPRPDDGSVYFKISSFPDYGKLSHLDERELDLGKTQNARANADEYEKDSVSDFVLWKARRPEDGENFWPSPWGEGRPGWHLECSAMIQEYLGDTFDLHSGGVDLVFPHHENEIAQSDGACGGHFADHWFHITHLLVDGGKMSKSLGNLYTLADLEAHGFTAVEVRYVLIGGLYRQPLNFVATGGAGKHTFPSLDGAKSALGRLSKFRDQLAAKASQPDTPAYSELVGEARKDPTSAPSRPPSPPC